MQRDSVYWLYKPGKSFRTCYVLIIVQYKLLSYASMLFCVNWYQSAYMQYEYNKLYNKIDDDVNWSMWIIDMRVWSIHEIWEAWLHNYNAMYIKHVEYLNYVLRETVRLAEPSCSLFAINLIFSVKCLLHEGLVKTKEQEAQNESDRRF